MPVADLSMGDVEYGDTGGAGPTVVLLHGLLMDGTVWNPVVARLDRALRCITPTLPLGAHRRPLRPNADLSIRGIAGLIDELLERLGVDEAVVVVNDLGAPLLLADGTHPRVGALVVTPCEAFDNIPPGLPGRVAGLAARVPGGLWLAVASLRIPWAARLPITFGWMSKRGVPRDRLAAWLRPALRDARIRRDLRRYITAARGVDLERATRALQHFHRPALVVWAAQDRIMPPTTDGASPRCSRRDG